MRTPKVGIFVLFFIVFAVARIASPAHGEPALKDAWHFTAFAAPYGRFKCTTTFDTAMMDNGIFRYSLKGPDFNLFKVFNPENKSYIETSVSQYATQWAPSIRYPKLDKVGKGKMFQLDCEHYTGKTFRENVMIDAWFTNALSLDKRMSDSFAKLCGLPTGYGLPVRVLFKSSRGTEKIFELVKLDKTRVAVETLVVPKSYHFVKDQALFFLSDEDGTNSGVDEFMRSVPQKKPGKTGAK